MTHTNPTPSELSAELRRTAKLRHGGAGSWCELEMSAQRFEQLLAALDRAAGPVEWTEADEVKLCRLEKSGGVDRYWANARPWLIEKLRAFIAAQKGAGR